MEAEGEVARRFLWQAHFAHGTVEFMDQQILDWKHHAVGWPYSAQIVVVVLIACAAVVCAVIWKRKT